MGIVFLFWGGLGLQRYVDYRSQSRSGHQSCSVAHVEEGKRPSLNNAT